MNNDISRREFAGDLVKALIFGGLAHFRLVASAISKHASHDCPGGGVDYDSCAMKRSRHRFVETDYCPGGRSDVDVCDPYNARNDYCPGEMASEDECSISGAREVKRRTVSVGKDDECYTGFDDSDICDNAIEKSDQCPAQNSTTDVCDASQSAAFDVCWSGLPVDDKCDENGGKATDECPGGGSERDTCKINGVMSTAVSVGAIVSVDDSEGDECSNEGGNPLSVDSCMPRGLDGLIWPEDQCGYMWSADVCYEGTNAHWITLGLDGGEDICMGSKAETKVRGHGGDVCLDGSDAQDDCGGINGDYNRDPNNAIEDDVCLPSAVGEKDDHCGSVVEDGNSDYCYKGLIDTDECNPSFDDKDECPGGAQEVDVCWPQISDGDECPGGRQEVDVCWPPISDMDECPGGGLEVDECFPGTNDPDECVKRGMLGLDKCTADDEEASDRCRSGNPDCAE